jgi:hypothetical protein
MKGQPTKQHQPARRLGRGIGCVLLGLVATGVPSFAQSQSEITATVSKKKKLPQKPAANPQAAAGAVAPAKSENADAHAAQNPIANVVSIPFQNNTYFEVGPYRRPLNALLVQPVIPVKLNADWNLVTRWITPVINTPRVSLSQGTEFGLGNLQPQFYLTPAHPGAILWGFGPQFWLPTATDKTLGVNKWGAGPAAAALTIQGPWVVGVLVNNVWAGTEGQRINRLTLNPFVNYNLPGGWYLSSSPVLTADWLATSSERWTVPIGGGIGRVFKVGDQPVNARVQVFNNVVRPTNAASWAVQFQIQFLYPAT